MEINWNFQSEIKDFCPPSKRQGFLCQTVQELFPSVRILFDSKVPYLLG